MMTQEEMACPAWNIAAKAENVRAAGPEKLSLLLFFEALMARPGGIAKAASEIVQLFPHRMNNAVPRSLEKKWKRSAGELQDWIRDAHENEVAGAIRHLIEGWSVYSFSPSINGFEDTLAAYHRIYRERRAEEFVHTTVSRVLFDTLDYALETRPEATIVFAEGLPSIGKTTAAEAWVEQHLGDARLISVPGIVSKTTLMRTISESLRLPIARAASGATAMQGRIEHFCGKTKIMLVFDRAEHLFPKTNTVNAHPAFLDYLTSLRDQGIPIALISWGQVFGERLRAIKSSTSWAANMFSGRISRCASLGTPTLEDCAAVTRRMLPEACALGVQLISKFSFESGRYLQAVADLASEARRVAKRSGRDEVTLRDIAAATDQKAISETKLRQMFGESVKLPRQEPTLNPMPPRVSEVLVRASNPDARQLSPRNITPTEKPTLVDK